MLCVDDMLFCQLLTVFVLRACFSMQCINFAGPLPLFRMTTVTSFVVSKHSVLAIN